MLDFVATPRRTPEKRDAWRRRKDFEEIYPTFARPDAAEQAGRCSQCGVPFCQVHCPLHNNIPDWLMLTAAGRVEEAYEIATATNNFPDICGRICPQDRLCEGSCVIEQSGHGTVTIGAIERFITETAWDRGWVRPFQPQRLLDQSVGIVGGGPAGLAAAEQLRRKGYEVHVYDRHDRIGGLLVYGIPNFKLEKQVVKRRVDLFEASGIVFHRNFEVGRDATLAEIRERHDAVLIATGVYKARDLRVPGAGLGNVVPALTYLIAANRRGLGDPVTEFDSGALNAAGKHVAVVGGGDTAMDCVRTAVRQGAASVRCLYRRDRNNMPGSRREVQYAEEEGVQFAWQTNPVALIGEATVDRVRVERIHLGVPDASGRQTPEPIEGSHATLKATLVIKALGFDPEDLPTAFGASDLAVTRWGTIRADHRTMATSLEGVFAAGDVVRGASLVVWAIRDGRDAAEGIHRYLATKALPATAMAAE